MSGRRNRRLDPNQPELWADKTPREYISEARDSLRESRLRLEQRVEPQRRAR